MDSYLVIQKMRVTEASMEAAPVVSGFPSVPAVMGFVHALQRRLQARYAGVVFSGAGIACHTFEPGIRPTGEGIKAVMSKNPPHARKHLDKGVPFIEEGKADLLVSIIVRVEGPFFDPEPFKAEVTTSLPLLRFAGGTIWEAKSVQFYTCSPDAPDEQKKVLRALMPGFVLMERRDLVEQSMDQGLDALDALLDHLEIRRLVSDDSDATSYRWERKSAEAGWLVPVSVGYRDISGTVKAANQRDPDCEHCFAENVLTLGEFIMPIRLNRVESVLWKSFIDHRHGLYLYTQQP